jgi:hypothetical protein
MNGEWPYIWLTNSLLETRFVSASRQTRNFSDTINVPASASTPTPWLEHSCEPMCYTCVLHEPPCYDDWTCPPLGSLLDKSDRQLARDMASVWHRTTLKLLPPNMACQHVYGPSNPINTHLHRCPYGVATKPHRGGHSSFLHPERGAKPVARYICTCFQVYARTQGSTPLFSLPCSKTGPPTPVLN